MRGIRIKLTDFEYKTLKSCLFEGYQATGNIETRHAINEIRRKFEEKKEGRTLTKEQRRKIAN
jgi:hypothetical protein